MPFLFGHNLYITRCVAMPSLMAARWVGLNSGPIFAVCGPQVHRIVCQCGSVRSLQRRFLTDNVLLHSRDIHDLVMKLCEIAQKFCFWAIKFREKGPPKFLTEFYKYGSPSNMWQTLVTIGQATSETRRQKDERRSKLQQLNGLAGGHDNWRAAIN